MKVMFYINSMSPAGGQERVVSRHIWFTTNSKHDAVLLTKDAGNSFYNLPENVERRSIQTPLDMNMESRLNRILSILKTLITAVMKIKREIDICKPDCIYVSSPLNLLEVYLACRNHSIIAVSEHSSFLAHNKIYKTIIKLLYPKIGLFFVPTKYDSNYYKSIGIDNVYLPNPLPFEIRPCSNIHNKVVLNIGRLTDDKRHNVLIDIWSKSNCSKNGWILKIIGTGERENALRQQIMELNLQESVIIEGPTKNIEVEYSGASIFALTSRTEGFGLVLAEALAFGVPCITFDVPSGPRDIVVESESGYFIQEGDLKTYIKKLDNLAENENIRIRFGTYGQKYVQKFAEKYISDQFISSITSMNQSRVD